MKYFYKENFKSLIKSNSFSKNWVSGFFSIGFCLTWRWRRAKIGSISFLLKELNEASKIQMEQWLCTGKEKLSEDTARICLTTSGEPQALAWGNSAGLFRYSFFAAQMHFTVILNVEIEWTLSNWVIKNVVDASCFHFDM